MATNAILHCGLTSTMSIIIFDLVLAKTLVGHFCKLFLINRHCCLDLNFCIHIVNKKSD